jgi:hypothetical protein
VIILRLPNAQTIQLGIQTPNALKNSQVPRFAQNFSDHLGRHDSTYSIDGYKLSQTLAEIVTAPFFRVS